ncbi:MAG: PAS domain S-box protein [Deltaproteobacteria bacterium]|nr:PAS domain S-box protein [Deltaproteobacteria bacterium]
MWSDDERFFRLIAENSDDLIAVLDRRGLFVYASPGYRDVLGYEPEELVGADALSFIHSDDRPNVVEKLARLLSDGTPDRAVFRNRHRDGSWRVFEAAGRRAADDSGSGASVVVTSRDVTERVRTEEALRESEARYGSLFGDSHAVMLVLDPESGAIVDANQAACSFYGYTRAQLRGSSVFDLNALPRERVVGELARAARGSRRHFFFPHRLANGEIRDVEVYSGPVAVAGRTLLYSIVHDVTDRTRAQAALREEQDRLERQLRFARALNSISEAVLHYDDEPTLLESTAEIVGETLRVDRCLIYDVDFGRGEVAGRCEWLNPSTAVLEPTKGTYGLNLFRSSVQHTWDTRLGLESHTDAVNPCLAEDGSAEWLHDRMGIRSLLWHPFSFRTKGFHSLIFHQTTARRTWLPDEHQFLDAAARQVDIALQKIGLLAQRTESERALRASEDRYRAIFETAGIPMIIIDEDTTISLANAEFERLSGCSKYELQGKRSWTEFAGAVDLDRMVGYHHGRRLDPDSAPRKYEFEFVDAAGRSRTVVTTVAMIPGSRQSVASYLDISESKRAEAALRASEEKYRVFFEDDLTGDFLSSPEGRLTACNPAFARIFGFSSPEAAVGFDLTGLYPSPAQRLELIERLVRERRLEYLELGLRRLDGEAVHVVANLIGRFDESGELREIRGYLFDDTGRKKLEVQLLQAQKLESVGQLAGGVAHDFNNILAGIMGHAELAVARAPDGHPTRRHMAQVVDLAERAAGTTRRLLAFSRRQVLEPVTVGMNDIVASLHRLIGKTLGERIEISVSVDPDLPPIFADTAQMEQVLLNLCINARDAMPEGGRLLIETRRATLDAASLPARTGLAPGEYVLVGVSDSGSGMEEAVRRRIFEPFFTTKEPDRGTGLGLAMVHGIVTQHRGFVDVATAEGRGTTFTVYLPAAQGLEERPDSTLSRPVQGGNETVLLVEDDEALRDLAVDVLQQHGYAAVAASNGEEALRLLEEREGEVALVVTDVVMPRMDGVALYDRVRRLRAETRFLFVSGYPDGAMDEGFMLDALVPFLRKPFNTRQLLDKVREALDRAPAAAAPVRRDLSRARAATALGGRATPVASLRRRR